MHTRTSTLFPETPVSLHAQRHTARHTDQGRRTRSPLGRVPRGTRRGEGPPHGAPAARNGQVLKLQLMAASKSPERRADSATLVKETAPEHGELTGGGAWQRTKSHISDTTVDL